MDVAVKEYDAKIDSRKRIELEPRVLVEPFEISEDSLRMVDVSMANMKKGKASEPIYLSSFVE